MIEVYLALKAFRPIRWWNLNVCMLGFEIFLLGFLAAIFFRSINIDFGIKLWFYAITKDLELAMFLLWLNIIHDAEEEIRKKNKKDE